MNVGVNPGFNPGVFYLLISLIQKSIKNPETMLAQEYRKFFLFFISHLLYLNYS